MTIQSSGKSNSIQNLGALESGKRNNPSQP